MNKLLFTEGGQPFYSDDLNLLQTNNNAISRALLGVVLGDNDACLLAPVAVKTKLNTSDLSQTIDVDPGVLLYDGMLCPFEAATVTVPKESSAYLCLRRQQTDQRVFEDGQRHYCRERWDCYLTADPKGAERYWRLDNLKPFVEVLGFALKMQSSKDLIKCNFFNGYSGTLRVKESFDDLIFTLDVTTTASEWNKSALGWKGMIGRIMDSSYMDLLMSHDSPSFQFSGKGYHIHFNELSDMMLLPDGVPDIYQDSVVIPLMPISITFSYNQIL